MLDHLCVHKEQVGGPLGKVLTNQKPETFVTTNHNLARHKISVRDYGKRYLTKVKVDRNLASNLHIGEIDTDCLFRY